MTRAVLLAASFATSALLMAALGAAFDRASSQPWLRDTPSTRLALDHCRAQRPDERHAQRDCVRLRLAEARARTRAPVHLAAGPPAPASAEGDAR